MNNLPLRRRIAIALGLAACAMPSWALFKVVAPDGSVTYTDRPPAAAEGKVTQLNSAGSADAAPASAVDPSLPPGLREAASRYPVTLYTINDCEPCDRGRELLRRRGIPFNERVAAGRAQRDEWPRLVGGEKAPALAVGEQRIHGLDVDAWTANLDAAGYPATSMLPATYRAPAPRPLVTADMEAARPAPSNRLKSRPLETPPAPPATEEDGSSTIKF